MTHQRKCGKHRRVRLRGNPRAPQIPAMQAQLRQLPASTARMLSSGQVILGPESVVKELLENALDAGATRIDIRLDACGLERLEVQDNGRGFPPGEADLVAMRHCTSKLREEAELTTLATYGFRGEALNSLCSVGQLCMATRCQCEELGREYAFDKEGRVASRRDAVMPRGTRATVRQLFHCLPVRRQQLRSPKRLREALVAVESAVRAAALANPGVRLALLSDGETLLSLPECAGLAERVRQVLSYAVWQQLRRVECKVPLLPENADGGGCAVAFVPASGADKSLVFRTGDAHCFLMVNRRTVQSARLTKILRSTISAAFGVPNKLPVCVLSLELPPESLDVNLNAAKTQIGIVNEAAVIEVLTAMLAEVAGTVSSDVAPPASADQSLTDVSNIGHGRHGSTPGVPESAAQVVTVSVSERPSASAAAADLDLSSEERRLSVRSPIDVTALAMQANRADAQLEDLLSSYGGGSTDGELNNLPPSPVGRGAARVASNPAVVSDGRVAIIPPSIDRGDSAGFPPRVSGGIPTEFPPFIDLGNSADSPPRVAMKLSPGFPPHVDIGDSTALSTPLRPAACQVAAEPTPSRTAKRPRVSVEAGSSTETPPSKLPATPAVIRAVPVYSDLASMHRRRSWTRVSCQAERLQRLCGSLSRPESLDYEDAGGASCIHRSQYRYVGAVSDLVIGVGAGALYGLLGAGGGERDVAEMRELLEGGGGRLLCKLT